MKCHWWGSSAALQTRLQVNKPDRRGENKQPRFSLETSGPWQLLLPRPTATALLHLDVIRLTGYIPGSPGSLFAHKSSLFPFSPEGQPVCWLL